MSSSNVRIIAPTGPTGAFATVNVATSMAVPTEYQTCKQVTAAQALAQPGNFPTMIAGATGIESGLTKGLKTILVSGYTGPS